MNGPERAILEVDYRWIEAVPLESLDGCKGWLCKALSHRDWGSTIYLLLPRDQWSDDDYFQYAQKKLKEIGV